MDWLSRVACLSVCMFIVRSWSGLALHWLVSLSVSLCVCVSVGGMFEWVSCANFLGEIVEWTGFAVACWSLPAAVFALMTACNLAPRAIHHHRSVSPPS